MSNAVYPVLPGLEWPVKKTPLWRTKVSTTPNGREFRSSNMVYPRYRLGLKYEFLRSAAALAEFQALFGFFNARAGAFDTFLFSDPSDYQATLAPFGTGDGSTTAWQLLRPVGGHTQPVYDLDNTGPAPAIYRAGALLSSGYSISATGVVTFSTAPSSGQALTWTGRYYWRCRFEGDELGFEQFMQDLWRTGEVRLVSCKP